jgi:hypothetical protein
LTPRFLRSDTAILRTRALRLLLLLHGLGLIALAFLVRVVSPNLPDAFARPEAYGNLIAGVLALLAPAGLQRRLAIGSVWVFNLGGTVDLFFAFCLGLIGACTKPGHLDAAYFIPTAVVPLLLITLGLGFRLLLWGDGAAAARDSELAA